MSERRITLAEVREVMTSKISDTESTDDDDLIAFTGFTAGGKCLRIVYNTAKELVVTVYRLSSKR